MDRVIFTAMTSASQALETQAITSNNLANITTPGFRAQLAATRAVPIEGSSMPTRTLVSASSPMFDASMGAFDYTGRELDVALTEDAYLVVQLPDGQEAFTRNGAIQVDENGVLRVQGYPLVGDTGLLEVPLQSQLTIGSDGTISSLGAGDQPETIAQVGQLKRVTAKVDELQRGDDGLFHLTAGAQERLGATLENDPTVRVMSGVLEGSNVNAVSSMVELISSARRFEMQMKVIKTADENEQRANRMLSMS